MNKSPVVAEDVLRFLTRAVAPVAVIFSNTSIHKSKLVLPGRGFNEPITRGPVAVTGKAVGKVKIELSAVLAAIFGANLCIIAV